MIAVLTPTPVGVVDQNASRPDWLAARSHGLGASDVAAALGFIKWKTQWQVWAEKTNARRPEEKPSESAEIGIALEPWLREKAADILHLPVHRTPYQLYRHPTEAWQVASPDGWVDPDHLVELKTAGIASGFGTPAGWTDDSAPLGYELQCRWQMRVLGASRVDLVALVANQGVRRYTYVRDLTVEADLVAQATEWWQRYVVARLEPPLGAQDNDWLSQIYPRPTTQEVIDLGRTNALEHALAYRAALAEESAAKARKEAEGAALKALLGDHARGQIDGHDIATWNEKKNRVDWERMARDLAAKAALPLPDPETYRGQPSRSLSVKEWTR